MIPPDGIAAPILPVLDDENRPFWEAARAGELRMQQCAACAHIRFPIQELCPRCLSPEATWTTLSGRGTVFARIVYHQAFHPAWKEATPYTVALVQLEEGPRMYGDVIGPGAATIAVGDRLEVVFQPATDEITIPRFRRAGAAPIGQPPPGADPAPPDRPD